jgi:hypothetical protein
MITELRFWKNTQSKRVDWTAKNDVRRKWAHPRIAA